RGRPVQKTREWPLLATDDLVIGERRADNPTAMPELIARDASGEVFWRREIHNQLAILPGDGALFVIDHSRRLWNVTTRHDLYARPRGLEALPETTAEFIEYVGSHPLFTQTIVTRLDAVSGEP